MEFSFRNQSRKGLLTRSRAVPILVTFSTVPVLINMIIVITLPETSPKFYFTIFKQSIKHLFIVWTAFWVNLTIKTADSWSLLLQTTLNSLTWPFFKRQGYVFKTILLHRLNLTQKLCCNFWTNSFKFCNISVIFFCFLNIGFVLYLKLSILLHALRTWIITKLSKSIK